MKLTATLLTAALAAGILLGCDPAQAQVDAAVTNPAIPTPPSPDPYETYVKTSVDFQRVKQDKDWAWKAWPVWTYMPWTYK